MSIYKKCLFYLTIIFIFVLLFGVCSFSAAQIEKPENYPTRAIEIYTGTGPGGGTDIFARAISLQLRKILGVPIVIINQPGSSGTIAIDTLQKNPADGYTILAAGPDIPISIALNRTKYNVEDFIPLAKCQHDIGALHVIGTSEFMTIQDLIDYAKANPKKLTIGGIGTKSIDEVIVAKWAKEVGIEYKWVPYDGAGEFTAALLGGHIDAIFEEVGLVVDLAESGKIKTLMLFLENRVPGMDVPASVELGYTTTEGIWRGLFLKSGTSEDIVKYLEAAIRSSYETPVYQAIAESQFLHIREGWSGTKEFTELLTNETKVMKELFKDLGYIE
ncbi:MAG: tripartite tricarboxylate transporter substrate binding protein [Atribacterota bacterium]|nr:tripartite tricarboxylate transporter substrate binding protein [Atribacterota bacterium]